MGHGKAKLMLMGVTMLITSSLLAGENNVTPRPTEARPLLVGNWADPTVLQDGDTGAAKARFSYFRYQPLDD